MDIYRKYDESKRLLLPVRQKYAGQVGDALSTTLHFAYRKGFLNGKTVWIVFNVEDEFGIKYAYSDDTLDHRFDGYTFKIPYEVTAGANGNQIDYQLVFLSASGNWEGPTDIDEGEEEEEDEEEEEEEIEIGSMPLERESSIIDNLVIERSVLDQFVIKSSIESQLGDPPTDIEGWIHYFKQYALLYGYQPSFTYSHYDGEHLLSFPTYNGQELKIVLNNVLKEEFGVWHEEVVYRMEAVVIREGRLFISTMDDNEDNDPLTTSGEFWKELLPDTMLTKIGPVERDENSYSIYAEGRGADYVPFRSDVELPFAEKIGGIYLPGIMNGRDLEHLYDLDDDFREHVMDDERHWRHNERDLYERVANKNQPDGYAGLDALTKVINQLLYTGNGPDNVMIMGSQAQHGEVFLWDANMNGGQGGIRSGPNRVSQVFNEIFHSVDELPNIPNANAGDMAVVQHHPDEPYPDEADGLYIAVWDPTNTFLEWFPVLTLDTFDLTAYQLIANMIIDSNDPNFDPLSTARYPSMRTMTEQLAVLEDAMKIFAQERVDRIYTKFRNHVKNNDRHFEDVTEKTEWRDDIDTALSDRVVSSSAIGDISIRSPVRTMMLNGWGNLPLWRVINVEFGDFAVPPTGNAMVRLTVQNKDTGATQISYLNLRPSSATRDGSMSPAQFTKLEGIEAGAQVNIIESISVNGGSALPIEDKNVDIEIPPMEWDTILNKPTAFPPEHHALSHTTGADQIPLGNGIVKGLSMNDLSDVLKAKLDNIEAGAQVNIIDGALDSGTPVPIVNKKLILPPPTAQIVEIDYSDYELLVLNGEDDPDITYLTQNDPEDMMTLMMMLGGSS